MAFLGQTMRHLCRQVQVSQRPLYLAGAMRSLSLTPACAQQQNKPKPIVSSTTSALDVAKNEQKECQSICERINQQVAQSEQGRLFAVVHLCGKQFKITPGDIILVEGYWPPTIGDEIRLDKVLLAGARDFTLIGRPILEAGLVTVKATVIEKTLTHTKTHFKKKRRKQYMRINFQRSPNTMIRINSIELAQPVVDDGTEQEESSKRLF